MPGRLALQHQTSRLGRDVAGSEPRAAGREHELRIRSEVGDRTGDRVALVRDEASEHLEAVGEQKLLEGVARHVVGLPARHAVGDGEDTGPHTSSFVFSTSVISVIVIPLSIALAMSYTVRPAIATAVRASISTPV